MTLHRFFVTPEDIEGDRFPVPAAIARQVGTVLRLHDGDRLVLLTGDGTELECRLEREDCVVEERRPVIGEPRHRLTIVQALLKGDGLETVVQRGTEVGVAQFRLVVTERCVARELSPRKLDRLRAIARESAEQSERGMVPGIEPPTAFNDVLLPGSVLLFERETEHRLRALEAPSVVIIGPEGGFAPGEVQAAERAAVAVAGLGPRILRAETVAGAVASVILSRTGDFA